MSCLTRTTTASLFFDISVAQITAHLDEARNLARSSDDDDGDDDSPTTIPSKPTWYFYNFRMMTQLAVLAYNVGRMVFAAYDNQGNIAVLSAVRCACLLGIIARHYFVCNYRWDMLMNANTGHLVKLQVFFMVTYSLIGVIAGVIDPYFASDVVLVIVFYTVPMTLRAVSALTVMMYAKLFTRVVDGILVQASLSPLIVFNAITPLFYFALCAANPSSLFFADRLLIGFFTVFPLLAGLLGVRARDQVNEQIRQKHATSAADNNGNDRLVVPSINDSEQGGRVFGVQDVSADGVVAGANKNGADPMPPEQPPASSFVPMQTPDPSERRVTVSMSSKGAHLIEEIARSKAFTEAKIFALITAVSCTFMVMQAAELAMSMGILHTTGAPANWCHPFSFADVNKGFQVVFDFLI